MAGVDVDVDRISGLPLELKISILSLLDIKYILRTSLLSRSWRHVWTHIPELTFWYNEDETSATNHRRLDHLLSSLHGPIYKFILVMRTLGTTQESESAHLQRVLRILLEKGDLRDLWIINFVETVQFRLPQFDSLQKLDLWDCSIELPHDFQGFRCLRNLNLHIVRVSGNDIQLLINRSTNLTTARLVLWPSEPMSAKFSNPVLTELHILISNSVKSVEVIFAPCLRAVRIFVPSAVDQHFNVQQNVMATLRFMSSIAFVSSLTVDFFTLHCFTLLGVPEMRPLSMQFHQLKRLRLFGQFAVMNNTFYSLLKSAPVIEILEIEYVGDDKVLCEPIQCNEFKKQDGFTCLDRTLKSVKIIMRTFNIAIGIWMPRFILVNATVLKLMEIKCLQCSMSELQLIDELHQIKPVSSDAKLLWEVAERRSVDWWSSDKMMLNCGWPSPDGFNLSLPGIDFY